MIRAGLAHSLKRVSMNSRPLTTSSFIQNQQKPTNNFLKQDYEITFHRQRQCKFHLLFNAKHKVYLMADSNRTGKLQYSWENGSPKDKTVIFVTMYFLGVAVISTATAAVSILFSPFGFILFLGMLVVFYV